MKGHFLIKTIFFGILAGINTGSCFAQQGRGTVTGSITSAEGKPAAHISVSIEHTTMGTTTDENGLYIIRNIRPGTYQVQVSAIGVLTLQKEAIVKEDSLTRLDFSLSETRDQMQEVVVSAGYNKFARKEVEDVARLPLKNLENPQVYNVIPVELLKDQSIISYNDVLKNVAGVSQALVNGSNSFNLRGFFTTSYLRNGLQDYKTNSIDVA
ncbi:MAG TPA: TonB-dependent receptor, partial [Niabella sp.]